MDTLALGYVIPTIRAHSGLAPVRQCACRVYIKKDVAEMSHLFYVAYIPKHNVLNLLLRSVADEINEYVMPVHTSTVSGSPLSNVSSIAL